MSALCLTLCFFLSCEKAESIAIKKPLQLSVNSKQIVAIQDTTAIYRDDLWPMLVELHGIQILEEYALMISIRELLQDQQVNISAEHIKRERELLTAASPLVSPSQFDDILESRGYKGNRATQLIWRSAALRELIKKDATVSEDSIKRMYEIVHGDRIPVRIIATNSLDEATDVIALIDKGHAFIDVAISHSVDSSASRGGLVEPIALADPIWPAPIRETISTLKIDEISKPVFMNNKWAIVTVIGEPMRSNTSYITVREEMKNLAIQSTERFLMQQLAERLKKQKELTILDPNFE